MGDIVFNIVGTSSRKCCCTSRPNTWLAHWKRGTGLNLPLKCCAKRCRKYVQVGAHVKCQGFDMRTPWIVPFCKTHNSRPGDEPIELKNNVTLCAAAMGVDCA